jgi:hypothetical protein
MFRITEHVAVASNGTFGGLAPKRGPWKRHVRSRIINAGHACPRLRGQCVPSGSSMSDSSVSATSVPTSGSGSSPSSSSSEPSSTTGSDGPGVAGRVRLNVRGLCCIGSAQMSLDRHSQTLRDELLSRHSQRNAAEWKMHGANVNLWESVSRKQWFASEDRTVPARWSPGGPPAPWEVFAAHRASPAGRRNDGDSLGIDEALSPRWKSPWAKPPRQHWT